MMRTVRAALAALLLPAALLAGCGPEADDPVEESSAEPGMEGLTPEEIRQQAEPLSPEQAAERGIVDTTIHVEQLTSPGDSALLANPGPPAPRDTVS